MTSCTLGGLLGDALCPQDFRAVTINGISCDSRRLSEGYLFLALPGEHHHGLDFLSAALDQHIAALCWSYADASFSDTHRRLLQDRLPVAFAVPDLEKQVGPMAARFYGLPSTDQTVIAVTGTDGKSSVCHLLAQALHYIKGNCGLLSSVGNGIVGAPLRLSGYTTPMAVDVQCELALQRQHGAQYVVLETSSHALAQGRIAGVEIDVAVLTNISRDHLDFHGSIAAYQEAKERLFYWPKLSSAVVNLADSMGYRLWHELPPHIALMGYSMTAVEQLAPRVDGRLLQGRLLHMGLDSMHLEITEQGESYHVNSSLLGEFQAANLVAAAAALRLLDMPWQSIIPGLERALAPVGRMESTLLAEGSLVVIDYAHTPQGLQRTLQTMRDLVSGTLWVVFGCGGERDRGKRSLMGGVASSLADAVVLTNDNPRQECPHTIVRDIEQGIEHSKLAFIELDRSTAIQRICRALGPHDGLLIAGKGHEPYQDIGGQKRPYSDQAVLRSFCGNSQNRVL